MKRKHVVKILLVWLVATVIVLGVKVAPSSAGGGGKEPGGGQSESHLAGPAVFGTITLTDNFDGSTATLDFQGQCKGKPVSLRVNNFLLYVPFHKITEKCTSCDEFDQYFEKSVWAEYGNNETLIAAGCTTSPDLVLTTVTKFVELDLVPTGGGDGVTDQFVAQGIFLFLSGVAK